MNLPRVQEFADLTAWATELVRRLEAESGPRELAKRLQAGDKLQFEYLTPQQVLKLNVLETWTSVFKMADESRISTIVPADDSELQIALDAASVYVFRLHVFVEEGCHYSLAYTGVLTSVHVFHADQKTGSAFKTETDLTLPANESVNATATLLMHGALVTDTAGTLHFQWAQHTAGLTPTVVKAGSYLEIKKL